MYFRPPQCVHIYLGSVDDTMYRLEFNKTDFYITTTCDLFSVYVVVVGRIIINCITTGWMKINITLITLTLASRSMTEAETGYP